MRKRGRYARLVKGRRNLAIDIALALAAFAATLALLGHGSSRDLDALGVLLAACATWPLVLRRRWPLGVLVVTTIASATLNGLDYALGPPFGPTLALFFVAADERTRARIGTTAAVVVALLTLHLGATGIAEDGFPTAPLLFAILVWGGAWVAGDQVRQRRQRLQQLEERARRAERERERERRLAAAEERTRIARDLHDSAGHAINVILVQAGAARLLQERDPSASRAALETIEEVARETISEIDQLVRALRDDRADDGPDGAVEPPLGLGALGTLVAGHRAAGLNVSLDVRGAARPLAPALDQAAYRILQETLTNATRHGLGQAEVVVAFEEEALELTASNTIGSGAQVGADGHGIVGMRERVALLGGSLTTDHSDGAFRVRVRLPYDGEAA
jgi:signal transduction histidine kinase